LSFFNIWDTMLFLIIPLIIMITCSIVIIIRLDHSRKLKKVKNSHSKEINFAFVVIPMDSLFLIFNLPICLSGIIFIFYSYSP
jgi:hypothetical protein